ncbi:hypothetical protein C2845_PM09G18490 [Panicum miliaceum]|uniref:Aminotransferase-like plant mobile domain-containing protein n=1 Tax=Panicum miliaceum TaxID=4540 RepID=A0A3L6S257_PANMI|nr:hypothetical protein C2845_PM09G18490 [Panicum miliaceum]
MAQIRLRTRLTVVAPPPAPLLLGVAALLREGGGGGSVPRPSGGKSSVMADATIACCNLTDFLLAPPSLATAAVLRLFPWLSYTSLVQASPHNGIPAAVLMFHGDIVKENGEFENMNEDVELFDSPPSLNDVIDRIISKHRCDHGEISLRGWRTQRPPFSRPCTTQSTAIAFLYKISSHCILGVTASEAAYPLTFKVGRAVRPVPSSGWFAASWSSGLRGIAGYGCVSLVRFRRSLEAGDTLLPFAMRGGHHHYARCGDDSWTSFGGKCSHRNYLHRQLEGYGGGPYWDPPPTPPEGVKDRNTSGVSSAWLRHVGGDANLGGCAYLLQIWIWERFPVGRPYRGPIEAWPHADAESRPTVAFCWKNVGAVRGDPLRRYMHYMDDLDCITQNQIFWTPYNRDELEDLLLSELCTRDAQRRSGVPLIFFLVVELHLPHRVKRQFWRLQDFPPEPISTSQALHNIDRKKRYSENDWRVKHVAWLLQWEQKQRMELTSGAVHRNNHYKEYLRWFHSVTRVSIKPPRSNVPIEERADTDDGDDIVDEYDDITHAGVQPERAPLENYMAQQLARLANEARVAIAHASGGENGGGHLRAFAEDSSDSEQDTDSDDTDPTYEVVGMSQMMDAPLSTQTQGEPSQAAKDDGTASSLPRRQRHSRDRTDIAIGNVLPTAPKRQRRPNLPFSLPEQPRRRR